jgi:ligand-binding SRPBCC domain-containing protein
MVYRHRFRVRAPIDEVAKFHSRASSLGAITPPPVSLSTKSDKAELVDGDEVELVLRLGPIAIPWLAKIVDLGPTGFRDVQLDGPFRRWEHIHEFESADGSTTDVVDTIRYELRAHLLWGPVGLAMGMSLPMLFAYRGWKTKRLLEPDGGDS